MDYGADAKIALILSHFGEIGLNEIGNQRLRKEIICHFCGIALQREVLLKRIK